MPSTSASGHHGDVETIDWASVQVDLDIVRDTRANLLAIGSESLVLEVIRGVIADVTTIVVNPAEWGRLALSNLWLWSGTLVFRDIDKLDAEGQVLLFAWLERGSAERQIVSTASAPLLPLVNAGAFDHGLYYRINTVLISREQPAPAPDPVRA